MIKTAPVIRILNRWLPPWNSNSGKIYTFVSTFIIYVAFHISRKPISVVKSVLHSNCSEVASKQGKILVPDNETFCDWAPFDKPNYGSLFGTLDMVYLLSYSIGMIASGPIADRLHIRYFLTGGALLSGLLTITFGLGYFFNIHSYAFFLIVQLICGAFQATGWPAVIACMGNWFGKSKRGIFMGLWNGHGGVGNALGSLIAGAFVNYAWGWSFVVPGLIVLGSGIFSFLCLIPYPEEVGVRQMEQEELRECGKVIEVFSTSRNEENASNENCRKVIEVSTTSQNEENSLDGTAHLQEPVTHIRSSESDDETTENQACQGSTEHYRSSVNLMEEPVIVVKPITFLGALRIPGVIEYSLCLFFTKMVSYTFIFWLPSYIRDAGGFDPSASADLSTVFDLGGIAGGVLSGFLSDAISSSAIVCVTMLMIAIPLIYIYYLIGVSSIPISIGLLIFVGLCINGPFCLMATTVSADLGTNPRLQSNTRALATVSGIINGTGSIGATIGPLLCGLLRPYGWRVVYIMLMICLAMGILLLHRRVLYEFKICIRAKRRI